MEHRKSLTPAAFSFVTAGRDRTGGDGGGRFRMNGRGAGVRVRMRVSGIGGYLGYLLEVLGSGVLSELSLSLDFFISSGKRESAAIPLSDRPRSGRTIRRVINIFHENT